VKSLQTRIILVFSTIILLSGVTLGVVINTSSEKLIAQSLGQQAQTIAEHVAGKIDLESYAKITPEGGETEYYKQLRLELNDLKATNNLKYLYTMAERKNGDTMEYYYVVDGAPMDAVEGDFSKLGEVEEEPYVGLQKVFEEQKAQLGELTSDATYGATVSAYVPLKDANGKMIGIVGADFDAEKVYQLLADNHKKSIMIAGAILLISILIIYLFARMIVKPLRRLMEQMERVQQGDLTVQVSAISKDEIGMLAQTFKLMVADLRVMIQGIQSGTIQLNAATRELSAGTDHTIKASNQITSHIQDAASGSVQQMQRAEDTARAMNEVSIGVQRIAASSGSVAESSNKSTTNAKRGNESIHRAMQQMESIHGSTQDMAVNIHKLVEQSSRVEEIVDVISGIASQTNLLALNAAIEAARAGDEGRGFAVVADQVRKLANQSEKSAMQIAQLIAAIIDNTDKVVHAIDKEQKEVESGLLIVREADEAFRRILQEVEHVADQVQEVSAVSEQIAAGSQEVTASVEEMARISRETNTHYQGIASSSEEQLAVMEQIAASTDSLNEMANNLQKLIEKFKV
jgi:methyl-accepting chemotaxis protein